MENGLKLWATRHCRCQLSWIRTKTTRELVGQFGCTHNTIENHLHAIGKANCCEKWVRHQLSDVNQHYRNSLLKNQKLGFLAHVLYAMRNWYNNTDLKR